MRALLVVAGVAAMVYGAISVLTRSTAEIFSTAIWFGTGIVAHDVVFAPLCLALWFTVLRRMPVWVSVAGFVTVALMLIAIPVLPREGSLPNPTVLDRDYRAGLLVLVVVVWVLAAIVGWAGIRRSSSSGDRSRPSPIARRA